MKCVLKLQILSICLWVSCGVLAPWTQWGLWGADSHTNPNSYLLHFWIDSRVPEISFFCAVNNSMARLPRLTWVKRIFWILQSPRDKGNLRLLHYMQTRWRWSILGIRLRGLISYGITQILMVAKWSKVELQHSKISLKADEPALRFP